MNQVHPESSSSRKSKSKKSPRTRNSKVAPQDESIELTDSMSSDSLPRSNGSVTKSNGSVTKSNGSVSRSNGSVSRSNGSVSFAKDVVSEEAMVISNAASRTIDQENEIINKVLEDQNPVFREENENEERALMNRLEAAEPSQLHAEYGRRAEREEERLREGFVDKNVVDEDIAREVKQEEEKLELLRMSTKSHVVANGSALELEEEHLRTVLERTRETAFTGDEEEKRISELLKCREVQETPIVSEGDVEFQDESIKLDRAHIVKTTIEGETENESHMRNVLERKHSENRDEFISHRMNREVEEAKLKDHYAKRATFQKRESESILKQNTRKNLAAVENKEGKLHFRTTGGVVQFVLHDSGNFTAQNNVHNLSEDFDYIHQRKRHLQHSDCVLRKDTGQWLLNKDSDYVNIQLKVKDFDSFTDVTGEKVHNERGDCTVENTAHKHLIPTDASIGQETKRHLRSKDSLVENVKHHDLRLVSRYHNKVIGHDLCPEGVFVQRSHKMYLPLAHTTEFRNSCSHFIPVTNGYSNRCRGVSVAEDCVLAGKGMYWSICENGEIVQTGMSHDLALTGSQDEQNREYCIPVEGSQDKNRAKCYIPVNSIVNRVKSCDIPPERVGDVRNRTNHHHHLHKTFTPWKRSKFSLNLEGSLDHEGSFGRFNGDVSWELPNNEFEIFDDLSIDEDYLNESDVDEDV